VKTYLATVRLDAVSDTDDAEGRVTSINLDSSRVPDRAEIERALANFVGVIMQRPPAYSALKVGGERAYRLARDGREVELEPRPVHIDAIRAIDFRFPLVELEIRCGKGTYVRSIARDLGRSLGLGGMLVALRRTAIGDSHVDDSSVVRPSLELFADAESNDANSFSERSDRRSRRTPGRSKPKLDLNDLVAKLSPLEMATAHLPAVRLDDEQRRMFDQGRRLLFDRVASFAGRTQTAATKRYDVEVRDDRERWIGVGRVMVTALERVDSPGSVAMMLAPHKGGFV
jgi:tRNA pseudouridine(55) synthase